MKAGKDVTLEAFRDVNLTVSQDTQSTTGSNKSSGGSIGVGVGVGSGGAGVSISANASSSKGHESGNGTGRMKPRWMPVIRSSSVADGIPRWPAHRSAVTSDR